MMAIQKKNICQFILNSIMLKIFACFFFPILINEPKFNPKSGLPTLKNSWNMYVFYTSAKQILEDFFKYLVL